MVKHDETVDTLLPPQFDAIARNLRNTETVATIYPWPEMQVGDSILFQADHGESVRVLRRRVGVSVYHYGKISGKKFTTKLLPDEQGFRVWRTH